jgi:hypothetical protein
VDQEAERNPPAISSHPESQEVSIGSSISLSVEVNGVGPMTFQWIKDGNILKGEDGQKLVIPNANATHSGSYSVIITNPYGAIVSKNADVKVSSPQAPQIMVQPMSKNVKYGETIVIKVQATGTEPFQFQWIKDGKPIGGATSDVLTIKQAKSLDAGSYSVLITNAGGAVTSQAAIVAVESPLSLGYPLVDENGNMILKAIGPNNISVTFQFSEDLNNWNDQVTLPLINGSTQLIVPVENNLKIIYRLKFSE